MAARLDLLVPELRDAAAALVDAASAAGLQPRVTSTLRSHAEQIRLYRRFLSGAAGFPVAPPGQSAHEYGTAFDMVVSPMGALADVGYTWQTWGGGWNPGDAIHFELPGASEWASRQPAYENPDTLAAKTSGFITSAFDFYAGSNVAGLLRLFPSLSENEALTVLSQPFESFQKWLISSIRLPSLK